MFYLIIHKNWQNTTPLDISNSLTERRKSLRSPSPKDIGLSMKQQNEERLAGYEDYSHFIYDHKLTFSIPMKGWMDTSLEEQDFICLVFANEHGKVHHLLPRAREFLIRHLYHQLPSGKAQHHLVLQRLLFHWIELQPEMADKVQKPSSTMECQKLSSKAWVLKEMAGLLEIFQYLTPLLKVNDIFLGCIREKESDYKMGETTMIEPLQKKVKLNEYPSPDNETVRMRSVNANSNTHHAGVGTHKNLHRHDVLITEVCQWLVNPFLHFGDKVIACGEWNCSSKEFTHPREQDSFLYYIRHILGASQYRMYNVTYHKRRVNEDNPTEKKCQYIERQSEPLQPNKKWIS